MTTAGGAGEGAEAAEAAEGAGEGPSAGERCFRMTWTDGLRRFGTSPPAAGCALSDCDCGCDCVCGRALASPLRLPSSGTASGAGEQAETDSETAAETDEGAGNEATPPTAVVAVVDAEADVVAVAAGAAGLLGVNTRERLSPLPF